MATLERIVRPVSSAPFSPAMPPQPTPVGGESDPVIIGGDGNLTPIQLHHTVTVTINEYEESYETKRKVDTTVLDLSALAADCDGFSGAEIEQAIVSALYAAHAARGAVTQEALLAELRNTRPLSVLMAEKVGDLREWAAGRTVPAD